MYKGFPFAMGMHRQAHADIWQVACISTEGTALQLYIKPAGSLNSNPTQLAHIWYVLIPSGDLTDLKHFEKRFYKACPCIRK